MKLGQDVLSSLEAATTREWLIADGLGGGASGTAAGAHTRRSHALLLAPDPLGRPFVSLLKNDERLRVGPDVFDLGSNLVSGLPGPHEPARGAQVIARPAGHLLLEEFVADPWPVWRWRAGGVTLEKRVLPIPGHHAIAVAYFHLGGPPARLAVGTLFAGRPVDPLEREGDGRGGTLEAVPGRVRIEVVPGGPRVTVWHSGSLLPARAWQRGLVYPADRDAAPVPAGGRRRPANGGPPTDAAFVPCYLERDLATGDRFHLAASLEPDLFRALAVEGRLGAPPPRTLGECIELLAAGARERDERWRRAAASNAAITAREAAAARSRARREGSPGWEREPAGHSARGADDPWLARLARAVHDGLARRDGRTTLVTALPGGIERGAETLRAVPALVTLRAFDVAREVVSGYVEYLNEGLAPECFEAGTDRPRYGDPAPALWLVLAAELLTRRSEDHAGLHESLLPAVEGIMQAYRAGTRAGIRVGGDGLLSAGEGEEACCRADVNALWFHALVATAQLARLAGRKESGAFYLAWAREHQRRVIEALWDERSGCLYDSVSPAGTRRGVSPAQLLAVSLSPPLLPPEHAARLVATVARDLFTPFGLRAAPGSVTASPAWLGPFITAHLRVHERSGEAGAAAHGWLEELRTWLDGRSAIHVPERIPAPRRGDAAARRRRDPAEESPAPASVLAAAELLRVWVEELDPGVVPAGVT